MVEPSNQVETFEQVLRTFCKNFGYSRADGILKIYSILETTDELNKRGRRADIVITCAVCADQAWWEENYGMFWEAARWWYCGPLGLNCSS